MAAAPALTAAMAPATPIGPSSATSARGWWTQVQASRLTGPLGAARSGTRTTTNAWPAVRSGVCWTCRTRRAACRLDWSSCSLMQQRSGGSARRAPSFSAPCKGCLPGAAATRIMAHRHHGASMLGGATAAGFAPQSGSTLAIAGASVHTRLLATRGAAATRQAHCQEPVTQRAQTQASTAAKPSAQTSRKVKCTVQPLVAAAARALEAGHELEHLDACEQR
ncbi:hypothetical protein JKP88DRAFT_236383 [Tribonema minus]|uniref:Uncharacterized protein n=1 Tax=Tribonema minus TaxID=303371 RepID=A0A835Z547_9STRA|nr:hypothetical protein JKP88DRAFT_236383 [Tribonema minus]